jgi:nucleoside phosphorylase
MAEPRPKLQLSAYTVGWICAMRGEYNAAIQMLDKQHQDLDTNHLDKNKYTLGDINHHNVAICRLPSGDIGKSSAQRVAENFGLSFPRIKLYLLVGVSGGMPYHPNHWEVKPIHLGDVVVGSPEIIGVVAVAEHDRGRILPDGFKSFSLLDKPIVQLVSAVDQIQRNYDNGDSARSFDRHLERVSPGCLRKKGIPEDIIKGFIFPGSENDKLFKPSSTHKGGDTDPTCSQCDPEGIIPREIPNSRKPVFHRGTIASGDTVIQNAEVRDKVSKACNGAISFEMEAAGIINDTHCLVIRGISDYADSHKNYMWQGYAAATAAAFARQVLFELSSQKLEAIQDPPQSISRSSTSSSAASAPRNNNRSRHGPETTLEVAAYSQPRRRASNHHVELQGEGAQHRSPRPNESIPRFFARGKDY